MQSRRKAGDVQTKRQETHCRLGAFRVSGQHNPGNNIHSCSQAQEQILTAYVNIHIPSAATAERRHCNKRHSRPLRPAAQRSVTLKRTDVLKRADDVCTVHTSWKNTLQSHLFSGSMSTINACRVSQSKSPKP